MYRSYIIVFTNFMLLCLWHTCIMTAKKTGCTNNETTSRRSSDGGSSAERRWRERGRSGRLGHDGYGFDEAAPTVLEMETFIAGQL
jgi:hypothetical protein